MEKALLQEMIKDREIAIQCLEKKSAGQDAKAVRLKQQHEKLCAEKEEHRQTHRNELIALWKEYDSWFGRYQDAKDALDTRRQKQNGGEETPASVPDESVYNEIMKEVVMEAEQENEAAGTDYSSNYVVRMQSQLCRAMHGMGVMETQRQLTKEQMDQIQKKAKDVVPEMIEEKSHVELKMVNDLIVADNSKREVEAKKNLQHETFSKQTRDLMDKIERQIEEALHGDQEDGDNAENDEEEEETKEELRGMLEEGKTEIERLQKVIEETEQKVEELKIRAAKAQGKDVVDDIVTSIAEEFAQDDDEGSDDGSY